MAKTLAKLNPTMTFIYVSGAGTDSTEHGRSMWRGVKRQNGKRAIADAVRQTKKTGCLVGNMPFPSDPLPTRNNQSLVGTCSPVASTESADLAAVHIRETNSYTTRHSRKWFAPSCSRSRQA